MSNLEALLLGIVQGLTEFLPISSSGHLILVPWLQDYTFLENHEAFNKTFDVALHAGTLVAVVSYFWRDILDILAGLWRSLRRREIQGSDERLAWTLVVGTIPAVIVGRTGAELHRGPPRRAVDDRDPSDRLRAAARARRHRTSGALAGSRAPCATASTSASPRSSR